MKNCIIIPVYNRTESLIRLLSDLKSIRINNTDIIISIDFHSKKISHKIFKISEDFSWNIYLQKIIKHDKRLGLEKHIISCGDISKQYDFITILEDDLRVSGNFINYLTSAFDFLKDSQEVAGISIYSYEYDEHKKFKFNPVFRGYDNY